MATNPLSVTLQANFQSPISRLSDDVLGDIFSACTDINCVGRVWQSNSLQHAPIPLIIIRRASQVCYIWRSVLLGLPRIWANCIDLDALDQEHDHWRALVLQRSGQSMLIVTGPTPLPGHRGYSGLYKFFVNLLQEHWARIQVCNVSINFFYPLHPIVLEVLSNPAENLKIFIAANYRPFYGLTGGPSSSESSFPPNFRLFSDHAPSLRHLSISSEWPNFPALIFSACPCNLRNLEIEQPVSITAIDLLTACLQMPLLEKLSVHLIFVYDETPAMHHFLFSSMSQLRNISVVCSDLYVYSIFLDRISTAAQCRLRVHHDFPFWSERANVENLDITLGNEAMERVMERYGDSRPSLISQDGVLDCGLMLNNTAFKFVCCNGLFEVSMDYKDHHDLMRDRLSKILHDISTFNSSGSVRNLTLRLAGTLPESLSSGVLDVLESMPLIAKIEIYPSCLGLFLQDREKISLFPSLKVLVLSDDLVQPLLNIRYRIIPLLLQQQKISPLEVLDLNENWWPDSDLHILDKISGLKVLWTRDDTRYEYKYMRKRGWSASCGMLKSGTVEWGDINRKY